MHGLVWHANSEDADTFHLSVLIIYVDEDRDITTDDKEGIILAPHHPEISSYLGHGLCSSLRCDCTEPLGWSSHLRIYFRFAWSRTYVLVGHVGFSNRNLLKMTMLHAARCLSCRKCVNQGVSQRGCARAKGSLDSDNELHYREYVGGYIMSYRLANGVREKGGFLRSQLQY